MDLIFFLITTYCLLVYVLSYRKYFLNLYYFLKMHSPLQKFPTPSPFIKKLQQILQNPDYFDVIHLNQSDTQIQITCKKKLQEILGHHFRHAKYESFVRQLNWYGFYKITHHSYHCYRHKNLEKGLSITTIKSRRTKHNKKHEREATLAFEPNLPLIGGEEYHEQENMNINNEEPQIMIYQQEMPVFYSQMGMGYPFQFGIVEPDINTLLPYYLMQQYPFRGYQE